MAYDRYDTRREHERGNRDHDRSRRHRDEDRGFFERAGDEIASWFGDDEAERRRRYDERRDNDGYNRAYDERDNDRSYYAYGSSGPDRDRNRDRSDNQGRSQRGYGGYDRDYSQRYSGGRGYSGGPGSSGGNDRSYRSSGYGGAFTGSDYERGDFDRSERSRGRGDYRRSTSGGTMRDNDRHYQSWRQRQIEDLDRDYDQYNRERQERFESDFGTWRESRMTKRQQLGRIQEHMDVVGSDGETVGKVDCVRDDRVVLTKSDSPDDRHHSVDCSMIDTVEGNQVRLDVPAEEAKSRWRDEERGGLFGRDRDRDPDRGERVDLERSFSGTYS